MLTHYRERKVDYNSEGYRGAVDVQSPCRITLYRYVTVAEFVLGVRAEYQEGLSAALRRYSHYPFILIPAVCLVPMRLVPKATLLSIHHTAP